MVLGLKRKDKIDEGFVGYDPTFIDERTRERMKEKNSNVFTRKSGMMPKSGDYMEVGRGCFGGTGTYFVPVHLSASSSTRDLRIPKKTVSFDLDMLDSWGDMPISKGRDYDDFREFDLNENERIRLKKENLPYQYKVLLVNSDLSLISEETRKVTPADSRLLLYNFLPGRAPFPERFNTDEVFPHLNRISAEDLTVRAILHPLYGLPKILLQKANS